MAEEGTPNRDLNFTEKANQLQNFSSRIAKTVNMVAAGGSGDKKKLAEALLAGALQVESLTPQLINAGRIRMAYQGNQAANEHFDNLKSQYSESVNKVRLLCDEAIDSRNFIKQSEDCIKKHTVLCEDACRDQVSAKMVDNASSIARLANRVLMIARQEADNSEDPTFIQNLSSSADNLQRAVPPMVQAAKSVALNMGSQPIVNTWRGTNDELINAVHNIGNCLALPLELNSGADLLEVPSYIASRFDNDEQAPKRPPPPGNYIPPPRPPPPETDDEDDMFMPTPLPNQPIMMAAHGLHQEVRQWSSKDNEIVAAAKRMALLMARLSQLVRGVDGTKKDLIDCAKEIAEASEEVTALAKELARDCTDKRMRTNLLQVCERIPTIGTQLKILSTVKATMLGAQGTEEDREATEMLVGNAQNLMQSVKETVRAAEAASIKMRTDAGVRMRWVRKQPWYQY
jgi:vinculin